MFICILARKPKLSTLWKKSNSCSISFKDSVFDSILLYQTPVFSKLSSNQNFLITFKSKFWIWNNFTLFNQKSELLSLLPQCAKEGNRQILVLNCLLRLSKTEILIWLQSTYVKLGNFVWMTHYFVGFLLFCKIVSKISWNRRIVTEIITISRFLFQDSNVANFKTSGHFAHQISLVKLV